MTSTPPDRPDLETELLTLQRAARELGIEREQLLWHIASGHVVTIELGVGGPKRIPRPSLEKLRKRWYQPEVTP